MFVVLAALSPAHDPASVVLTSFEHHRIVALGENHGHKEFHAWLERFLERPAAQAAIDDIVVEWGNARYQDLVDRYMQGQEVPWDSVTMAWRNTVVSPNTVWDAPVYAHFFRSIGRINAGLEPDARYRVLLADSPVNWDEVETREDLIPFFDRSRHMAELIRKESLLEGRRSLFIAGGLHVSRLPRRRIRDDGVSIGEVTPVAWIELKNPGSVFVIQSMARAGEMGLPFPEPSGEPVARIVVSSPDLAGIPANQATTLRNRDGSRSDVYGPAHLSDIVDAIILWDPSQVTLQDADPSVYEINWYWNELNRRSQIMRSGPMDPSLRSGN